MTPSNSGESDSLHLPVDAGLCTRCIHARTVMSARSKYFSLCTLSESDPLFPKYPKLPVVSCAGFTVQLNPKPNKTSQSK